MEGQAGSAAKLELETFLPYRLNVLATIVSQGLSGIYAKRYGIGVPEWRVMATLGQFGAMTAKDIGSHSRMHKTKVSRAVAVLEKRLLVQRRANRQDLREAFLSLSEHGRAIYDDLVPVALTFAAELTQGLTRTERAELDILLAKLMDRGLKLLRDNAEANGED
ncbi:MarR family transcriptional regulator [Phreatobacter stygius]|uniref:MarR family transcriptional regulator n=2 Tax=Phreatobacter stygius TaxID=1940610 RepID=A0A4D7BJS2_9HYPH|nr:MarR family transcriptional regulator [Phreatobacter stygius]